MSGIPLIDPSDSASFTLDWSDAIGASTLGTVTHTVVAPLTKVAESTDASAKTSTVRISGAVHGGVYMIEGQTTLSSGEVLNRQFPLRCFNS
jgi:hypothetical protein